MRISNNLNGTHGFAKAYDRLLTWRDMRNPEEVDRRSKILDHWKKHGIDSAMDAFSVSSSTLYLWRKELRNANGNTAALDPKSTAPKNTRRRIIPPALEHAIIQYRTDHPGLGKQKLTPLLKKDGFIVAESYIGRCIADLKKRHLIGTKTDLSWYARSQTHRERPKTKVKKIRRTVKRGLEVDTVVRHIDGIKRYTLTAIDVRRKIAYARTYTTHSSASARDFLKRLIRYMPFDISEIQTDNGSEFAKYFHEACDTLGIVHYHTYPRCPKMNAFIERFNRTVSEEFLQYNRQSLAGDIEGFNEKLRAWLHWYNFTRPHASIGLLSPMEYYMSIENS